jgi:hypothetical protein
LRLLKRLAEQHVQLLLQLPHSIISVTISGNISKFPGNGNWKRFHCATLDLLEFFNFYVIDTKTLKIRVNKKIKI